MNEICTTQTAIGRSSSGSSWRKNFPQRTNDRAVVHDVSWIKGGLETAHRSDAAGIAILLQKMLLEPTDAVLSDEHAAEHRGRVEFQRGRQVGGFATYQGGGRTSDEQSMSCRPIYRGPS